MQHYNLAQVNIAKCLAPLNDPIMQGFVNNVQKMNAIADQSEGFIWRLQDEDKSEVAQIFKDPTLIVNISVWKNIDSLFNYTYKTEHANIFKHKNKWFSKIKSNHMAFWYIPENKIPTLQEAKHKLDYLNKNNSTPYAFTFKDKFSVTDFINYKPIIKL
ncbi:DUF3291 domain-containing protein [Neotamlana laminarinivorans]|uniref:DUF3291 domain-containing protein n=1 Tax=Neotamlana laminarinivorans TaxID=2883124 RepID=A0A9X1HXG0_9FLAO|nr:DUF3291 domain-containing protein [Tamlana laminarinivorans]MCB4797361.1 DUF3291 domain-containing protein [Tamlana laminarinivorans]